MVYGVSARGGHGAAAAGGLRVRALDILHVDPELGWGGGEAQVVALCCYLRDRGHRVALAAAADGALAAAAHAAGLHVYPLVVRHHLDAVAGLRLRALVRGRDVIHFHTARAHALALWLGPRRGRPRRVVTRRMDYVPRGGPYARLLYNRLVDGVVAISGAVRRALVTAGVDPARVRVIPSGVARKPVPRGEREALRARLGVGPHDVVVLAIGALERRKGFDVLVTAAAQMVAAGRSAAVVVAGDGSQRQALERAAAGVDLHLLGHRDDVPALLEAADIVAVPSRKEGLGLACLEAMAAGKAVVASRVGGLAEAIEHRVSGILVAPGDAAALARALIELYDDPGLRSRLGTAARLRAERCFSVESMAAANEGYYLELLGLPRTARPAPVREAVGR